MDCLYLGRLRQLPGKRVLTAAIAYEQDAKRVCRHVSCRCAVLRFINCRTNFLGLDVHAVAEGFAPPAARAEDRIGCRKSLQPNFRDESVDAQGLTTSYLCGYTDMV